MISIRTLRSSRVAVALRDRRTLLLVFAALIVPIALIAFAVMVAAPALDATERIPVAVVNLDKGATDAKGRSVSYGDDLVDSLQQTGNLGWDVVDEDAADAGIVDGTYALALKVPKDYSEKVASLSGDAPEKAVVEIVSDGSENVLATRAGSAALRQVQSRLKSTLGEDYMLSVLNDVRGQATRLSLTADGSVMLDTGYDALKQGASAISTGLDQTAAAAGQLTGGLGQIAGGVAATGMGANALAQGITAVQQQAVAPLAQGADALVGGLDQVATTAQVMGQGMSGIGTALGTLQQTLASANDDLAGLMGVGVELKKQGKAFEAASTSLGQTLVQAQAPMQSLINIGTEAAPKVAEASADAAALKTAISSDDPASGSLNIKVQKLQETVAALKGADAQNADEADPSSLSQQVALLEQQVLDLEKQLDENVSGSVAAQAAAASASVSEASTSLANAPRDAGALKPLAGTIEASSKDVTAALVAMGQTTAGQQQAIQNVAGALMGGQAILKGTDPTTGESRDLAVTASALGQGVSALGEQLSSEGTIGQGVSGIATGTNALSSALAPMATGAGQLAQGNVALGAALGAVAQGAGGLGQGLTAMASATGQLGAGVDQLKEASGKISETMDKAGETLADVASDREDRAQVASNPVTFTSTSRNTVEGAASTAAPAAIAAALWVGALLTSLALPAIDRRAVMLGRGAASVLTHAITYLLFSLAQAFLIGIAAMALGVQAGDVPMTVCLLALGAASCAILAQFIRLACGRVAGAVSITLLALQLLSSGAILPASFTGGIFTALGSVLPLPVLAEALRGALAGSDVGLQTAVVVLIVWTIAAVAASLLITARRRTIRPERAFAN